MPADRVGRADYELRADQTGLVKDLKAAEAKIQASGKHVESRFGDMGKHVERGFMVAGAATAAFGAAALKMGTQYDDAIDTIRIGTGATGDLLQGLEQSFKNVASRVPEDIGVVSQVIADLNTRTGATGETLEGLAKNILDLSRITGTDAAQNVALLTRLYGDWSVATEDQVELNDKLFRTSQATGIGVDTLMQKVVQFGAPMRAMGLSIEESIALLGKWEKEGVNVETVLGGLRMAVGRFASMGLHPAEGLRQLIDQVKNLDDAQGLLAVKNIVGQRAANDFFRAIKEGRFDVAELMGVIENGTDTIDGLAEETKDADQKIKEFKNTIVTTIGPMAAQFAGLSEILGPMVFLLPAVGAGLGKLAFGLSAAAVGASTFGGAVMALAGPAAVLLALHFAAGELTKVISPTTVAVEDFVLVMGRNAPKLRQFANDTGIAFDEVQAKFAEFLRQGLSPEDALAATRAWTQGLKGGLPKPGDPTFIGPIDAAGKEWGDTLKNSLAASEGDLERVSRNNAFAVNKSFMDFLIRQARAEDVNVWADGLRRAMDKNAAMAAAGARATGRAHATGLLDVRGQTDSAWDEYRDILKNSATIQERMAELSGRLSGRKLAEGLNSSDPLIRAAAQEQRIIMTREWQALYRQAWAAGNRVGVLFGQGINSPSSLATIRRSASNAAKAAAGALHQRSPAEYGPLSEDGGSEGWGRIFGELLARGMGKSVADVRNAAALLAGAAQPAASLRGIGMRPVSIPPSIGMAGASGSRAAAQPVAKSYHVSVNGPVYGGALGLDELTRELRQRLALVTRE